MKKHRFAKKLAAILAFALILGGVAPAGSAKAASLYYGYTSVYGKCARTAYNAGLKKLLGNQAYAGIYLRNLTGETVYTIPEGNYGDQRLWVNTPYSDVENHGTFTLIKIMNVKNTTWHEYAQGNNFAVSDKKAGMVVEKGASVNKLYFQADNGTVNLQVNGEVKKAGFYGDDMAGDVKLTGKTNELKLASKGSEIKVETAAGAEVGTVKIEKDAKIDLAANSDVKEIVLNSPATLKIEGDAEKIAVTVTEKAEGAKVETSVPVETSVGAKVDLTLNKGAEGSTITKTNEKVDVAVKNDTEEKVEIGTEGSDKKETVEAGKEIGTDDGKTDGGKTDDTSGGNNGGGGYVPDPGPVKTQLTGVSITPASVTASVAVGNVLTAEAAPAGATVSYQWYRGDTPISGATEARYTVTADDKGYALHVTAAGTGNYTGTVTSAVTATVPYAPEKVVITADGNIAAVVSGGSVVLKAEVLPALSTEKTVTWSVTTGSSFDGTADLTANTGESTTVTITGTKGTVTVKAQAGNVSSNYEITVTDDADAAALANAKAGAKAEINAMLKEKLGSSVTAEYENGYTKESVDALLAVASFAAIDAADSVEAVNTQLAKQKSDVKAALDALVRAYTVTFYGTDGKELSITDNPNKRVAADTKLVVPATEPTKNADDLATYEFAGWSENKGAAADDAAVKTSDALSGSAITADASYYPIFRAVAKTYTITWYDGDGTTELATASAVAGTKAGEYTYSGTTTPVKAASSTAIVYRHTGWRTAEGTEDLSNVTVEGDLALYPVFEMEPVTYKELTLTTPDEIHPDDKGNLFANYDIKDGDTDIDLVLPKGEKDGIIEMWITSDNVRTQVVSGGAEVAESGWEFADADTADENGKELNLGIAKWGGKTLTLEVILTKTAYKITVTPPTAEACILQAEGITAATPTKVQKRKHAFGEEDTYVTFAVYKDANIVDEKMYPATNTAIAQETVTSAAVGKLVYLLSDKWTDNENNNKTYQMTAWYVVSEEKGVISNFSSKIGPKAGDSGAGDAIELHDIMLNLPVNAKGRTYYAVVQEGDATVLYKIVIPATGAPLE